MEPRRAQTRNAPREPPASPDNPQDKQTSSTEDCEAAGAGRQTRACRCAKRPIVEATSSSLLSSRRPDPKAARTPLLLFRSAHSRNSRDAAAPIVEATPPSLHSSRSPHQKRWGRRFYNWASQRAREV